MGVYIPYFRVEFRVLQFPAIVFCPRETKFFKKLKISIF